MSVEDPNVVNAGARKRIAIVLANAAVSSTSGWPVGFWWSELTHPYLAFMECGYEVELFSPDGGACAADAMSDPNDASGYSHGDLISQGFMHTPRLRALIDTTAKVSDIQIERFDAILVAGGQSPMFTFAAATDLQRVFAAFHEAGKIAAALCHGVAILAHTTGSDGLPLVQGKTITGFANIEEDFADNAVWTFGMLPQGQSLMPWRIEDRLRELGGNFVQAGLWRAFAIRDGNLITGQQNFSGAQTARLIIEALGR